MINKQLFKNDQDWNSWLASTGFLFPRNELELARYNKLYGELEQEILTDSTVSIDRILSGKTRLFPVLNPFLDQDIKTIEQEYRMVARKGLGQLPDHIREKMKKNQQNDDNGNSKKED